MIPLRAPSRAEGASSRQRDRSVAAGRPGRRRARAPRRACRTARSPREPVAIAGEVRDLLRGAPRVARGRAVPRSVSGRKIADGVGARSGPDDRRDGLQDPVEVGHVARRRGDRREDLVPVRLDPEPLVGLLLVREVGHDDLGSPGSPVTVAQEEGARVERASGVRRGSCPTMPLPCASPREEALVHRLRGSALVNASRSGRTSTIGRPTISERCRPANVSASAFTLVTMPSSVRV